MTGFLSHRPREEKPETRLENWISSYRTSDYHFWRQINLWLKISLAFSWQLTQLRQNSLQWLVTVISLRANKILMSLKS